jgi:hypothetical protein
MDFLQLFESAYDCLGNISQNNLLLILTCAFAIIFLVVLAFCAFSTRVRLADKTPFLHLSNAFSALALGCMLCEGSVKDALFFACIIKCSGYIMYAILNIFNRFCRVQQKNNNGSFVIQKTCQPYAPPTPISVQPLNTQVKLEHAISMADKLLNKNASRTDVQELERIKQTFMVLKIKEKISPAEGEILNDSFNALIKLAAKYDL